MTTGMERLKSNRRQVGDREGDRMNSTNDASARGRTWVWAWAIAVVVATSAAADLSRPDAVVFGQISINGQPVASGVVSARAGEAVLDSFTIGSNPSAPELYGLAIPVKQSTEGVGDAESGVAEGGAAQLFLDDRLLTQVVVRGGTVTRVDVAGGEALCSGGGNDGQSCTADMDCPGGFCVAARAICDGGGDDGQACECIGGTCDGETTCAVDESMGVCQGGPLAGGCCDPTSNCADGAACTGTQRLCEGGAQKGMPCLRDNQCPGSSCVSTGLLCNGGSAAGFACVDDGECPGGTCGERIATPTPTRTRTPTPTTVRSATPTPTQMPSGCVGDCDGSGGVAIAELVRMVNVALGRADVSLCTAGDANGDGSIAINELIQAVNRALNGC